MRNYLQIYNNHILSILQYLQQQKYSMNVSKNKQDITNSSQ